MNDQKSIFGILAGLLCLFAFWLWATGKFGQLKTALGATPAATPGDASKNDAANVTGGNAAPLSGTIQIPNYQNTTAAANQLHDLAANVLGGNSAPLGGGGGAISGAVSITPSIFVNSASVAPDHYSIDSTGGKIQAIAAGLSTLFTFNSLGNKVNAASQSLPVQSPGVVNVDVPTFTSFALPAIDRSSGDAANVTGGNSAPL
jgi:hypothetical protein